VVVVAEVVAVVNVALVAIIKLAAGTITAVVVVVVVVVVDFSGQSKNRGTNVMPFTNSVESRIASLLQSRPSKA